MNDTTRGKNITSFRTEGRKGGKVSWGGARKGGGAAKRLGGGRSVIVGKRLASQV